MINLFFVRPLAFVFLGFWLIAASALPAHAVLPVRSAILINVNTGKVLYEKNASTPIPPASLTKLMTMYLAMTEVNAKRASFNDTCRISPAAANTGGSSMHLSPNEKVTLQKLLTGMIVASGNDAARAVAAHISGSEKNFVRSMNRTARALGMRNTLFKNPTGLPAKGQMTTARDMLILARVYLRRYPRALTFHQVRSIEHGGRCILSTNKLLGRVPGVDGLKTGYTAASGYNLIFTAQRGKTRLLGVVMGGRTSAQRDRSAQKMLEAGFKYSQNATRVARALR
ncbi:MAG: D-alanyl-D-alanine carboxypeptidase [Desulfovibrionaceae bacterium]|nr:D-alanyl-D-alanine carboxypeptidase [Desulfovibrionaceae bacterium]